MADRGLAPGKALLTFQDAAYALSCGRTKVWEMTQRGELVAVGKGKGRRISAESVRDFVRRLEEEERKARGRNNEGPRANGGQKGDRK